MSRGGAAARRSLLLAGLLALAGWAPPGTGDGAADPAGASAAPMASGGSSDAGAVFLASASPAGTSAAGDVAAGASPAGALPDAATAADRAGAAAAVAQLERGDELPPAGAVAAARELIAHLPPEALDGVLAGRQPVADRAAGQAATGGVGAGRQPAADPAARQPATEGVGTGQQPPADPAVRQRLLAGLGRAAGAAPPADAAQIGAYLAAWARERGLALGRRGAWTAAEVASLSAQQLVDVARFASEAGFRAWVVALLPRELDPRTAPALRDELLAALDRLPAVDFDAGEAIASAWGAAPRRSSERLSAYGSEPLRFDDDPGAPIAASIFSLPSSFFAATDTAAFLRAVAAVAPGRELIVLGDPAALRRLAACCAGPRLHLLETYGRPLSPWTRDPMSLTRRAGGGVTVLVRPNAQRGREEDLHMGAALVQQLPAALDRAWGGVRWEVAPVPFHNGQVLLTADAAWISLHTLEPRILALLGEARVPVESFATAAGIDRYVAAARRAAGELAELYRRPVRFVHPLPAAALAGGGEAPPAAATELVRRIGGGAGYDLDSLLTLLPPAAAGRPPVALVASVAAGRALLGGLAAADWDALRRGYALAPSGAGLAGALDAAQATAAAARLDEFLDLAAAELGAQGFRVDRLPLLAVPVALLADPEGVAGREFLLTWNNVVVETRQGRLRAEGFSSLLPAGDRQAERMFAAAGCRLDLLPALTHSIVLNGGYRCASNHLRAGGTTRAAR